MAVLALFLVACVAAVVFVARPATKPKATGGAALRVGLVKPQSLDPAQARTVDELLLADQLFDSLTAWDPKTLEPIPSIAASWTASDDQQHFDFHLKPGAQFANGRPITAADVKYTLERIARKDSASSVYDLLEPIAGYAPVAIDGTATDLAGITAPSDDLVHIDLDQPMALLPSLLGSPAFGIVAKEAVEAPPPAPVFAEQPVGSGPYKIVRRSTDRIELAAVRRSAVRTPTVTVDLFADKTASYQAFTGGRLDLSQVPPERASQAATQYGRAHFKPYVAELFYGFNLKSPTFADVRFREAIIRAVNRKAIISAIYADTVRPMGGFIVDGVPGHQADVCGDRCAYDPDKARALIAEVFAGAAPPEVPIDYDEDKTQEAVAKAIQTDLAAVGVTATLRSKPLADYQNFADGGEQQLFRLGWIAAYPSADAFLTPLFVTNFPSNLTGFSSPAVDDLLRSARADGDAARRVEKFQAAERAIFDQLPVLPIAQFDFQVVVTPRVRGLTLSSAGSFDASKVSVDGKP
jgi:peptide/nickel transport system substrate-binding protein/oligopeptide transport system substrate-binding protein